MRNKRSVRVSRRNRTKALWSVNYLVEEVSFRRGIRSVKVVERQMVARGGAQLKKSMTTLSLKPEVVSWTLDRLQR